jgi:hypothetical protein
MGAVSLLEDNVERYIQSNRRTSPVSGGTKPPVRKPLLRYCPLCVQGYLEALQAFRRAA